MLPDRNKAIPVTGHGDLRLRGSHIFYIIGLRDGGEVVSLTRRPLFNPQEDSWYAFMLEAELIIMRLEGLGKLKKKFNYLIRIGTRDLPACGITNLNINYLELNCHIRGTSDSVETRVVTELEVRFTAGTEVCYARCEVRRSVTVAGTLRRVVW
jgi:hypothetical protein